MDAKEAFNIIYSKVKNPANYIPREYKTVGGMWTVDTYQLGSIKAHSMDEGYTDKILTDHVIVLRYHTGTIDFIKGDEQALIKLAGELGNVQQS